MGFFLILDNEVWNYNFIGIEPVNNMSFGLSLGIPRDFYNEIHQPTLILNEKYLFVGRGNLVLIFMGSG